MTEQITELLLRYPGLSGARADLEAAAERIIDAYRQGGTVFTCGNGGSAADSDHIVGELMKGFLKKRPVSAQTRAKLAEIDSENADFLADHLQCGLPAVSLHSQSALLTAFANDVDASMMLAQTLFAMGKSGDVLLAMSTSGNSKNVVNAAKTAKLLDMTVVALTGEKESQLSALADVCIRVGETETYKVQELHLPAYHWLCARVEDEFFAE